MSEMFDYHTTPKAFHVACARYSPPRIECGDWTARCVPLMRTKVIAVLAEAEPAQLRSEREMVRWGMRVEFTTATKSHRFDSEHHPENKYPLTTEIPTAVQLATFLEECQRVLAERDAG